MIRRPPDSTHFPYSTLFRSAIADRPAGSSVLDAFRTMTHTVLDVFVAGGDEDLLAVAKIIRGSPVLQERLTLGWESEIGRAHARTPVTPIAPSPPPAFKKRT